MDKQTEKLKKESLQNVELGVNEILGDITVSKDKILVLSIPYNSGFKAYVDGEEASLVKANGMYMAVELSKGSHHIQLTYRTPYLLTGAVLSVLGLLAFAGIFIWNTKKKR